MTAFWVSVAVLTLAWFLTDVTAWVQRRRVAARHRRRVERALAFHTRPREGGDRS